MRQKPINRRNMLKWSATAAASTFIPFQNAIAKKNGFDDNYIIRENLKEGTTDWLLQNPQFEDVGNPFHWYGPIRSPWIEGYADKTYIRACEDLTIHVSTNPSSQFTADVYRIGYYGGTGGRFMGNLGSFQGTAQPMPVMGAGRLMDCDWAASHTFSIPSDWLSGYYVIKLTELSQMRDSYIAFTVIDDRQADFGFSIHDFTYQCYNRWPEQHSLYNQSDSDNYWAPGTRVSFNRPMAKMPNNLDQPLTLGGGIFFTNEYPFVYWLEKEGYDVSYVTERSWHYEDVNFSTRFKGMIISGHSEYWTQTAYDKVVQAKSQGMSFGFFCANTIFGRISLSPDSFGNPDKVLERVSFFNTENQIQGGRMNGIGSGDWRCMNPSHWIFENTGMTLGSSIKGLVGQEYDSNLASIPGIEMVATGDARSVWTGEITGQYTASVHTGAQGNVIFHAATIRWADCLSSPPGFVLTDNTHVKPDGPDDRCQQITRNFLDRVLEL